MDNAQFRRLLVDKPSSPSQAASPSQNVSSTSSDSRTSALGSRLRSSIPMTPRSVAGYTKSHALSEFAKQVSDAMGPPSAKRLKSSATPKGTKLAEGYIDRVAMRREDERTEDTATVGDDTQARLSALEQMVKSGQMESESFEKLRRQILGEEVKAKRTPGLDWEMLRKARQGENVGASADAVLYTERDETLIKHKSEVDIDEEFEGAIGEKQEITSLDSVQKKEVPKKKGVLTQAPGKLTRDEILKEFKKHRRTVAGHSSLDGVSPALGSKFKKLEASGPIQGSNKKRWIEFDEKSGRRREVLMVTDRQGNSKRKARWLDEGSVTDDLKRRGAGNGVANKERKKQEGQPEILGMEIPAEIAARQRALLEHQASREEDDDNIFLGVGADYNPLDDPSESSDSSSSSRERMSDQKDDSGASTNNTKRQPSKPRNYFSTSSKDEAEASEGNAITEDPTLMAAIKRAAAIGKVEPRDRESPTTDAEVAHRKQFLEHVRKREKQDEEDLDMDFGESRYGDDDDDNVVLNDGEISKKVEKTRKRGPRKKKGNKENVGDVMGVLSGKNPGEGLK